MAFFGLIGNYSKPGPGVSKDEIPKAAPLRFLEILWRKLSKLIQVNLIFMIPFAVCLLLMFVMFILPVSHFAFDTNLIGVVDLWILYGVPAPLMLLGPFTSGIALITRNFAREEHAFIWSDYWDAVKANWKPALLNSIIVYVAYVALSFSIFFYSNQMATNWLFIIPFGLCCLLSILMLFAQYYVPVMIVTFDLKLRHIYRNAFIFAVLGLFRNLLITAVIAGIIIASLFAPGVFIFVPFLLLIIFIFAFVGYLTSFTTYPVLDKYLIQPFYKKAEEANAPAENTEEGERFSFENDELDSDDEDDSPQYVYMNGKLVDKKTLKEESVFSDETHQHLN